jgi:hypothetical protein
MRSTGAKVLAAMRGILALGILQILASLAYGLIGGFYLGMAWVGSYGLCVSLEKENLIDFEKLAAIYDRHYAKYAHNGRLSEALVTDPARAAQKIISVGALLLGLFGLAQTAITAHVIWPSPHESRTIGTPPTN